MGWIMKVVKPLCIGLLCFWLLQKKKMSVPKVIGIAAALGVVGSGVL